MSESRKIAKLTVNNQIVSMRRDVKRARLWLINNLNQRIKRLSERKGNELQKAKVKRKAERLRSEMEVLKHIDIDDVSKYALCTKIDLNSITTELEKLEPEQRAMFRLAVHKLVQAKVSEFREKHPVSLDQLILAVRALGSRYQKKKQKKNAVPNTKESPSEKTVKTKKKVTKKPGKAKGDQPTLDSEHKENSNVLNKDSLVHESDENNTQGEKSVTKEKENIDNFNGSDQTNAVEEHGKTITELSKQEMPQKTKIKKKETPKKAKTENTEKSRLQIKWPELNQNQVDKIVGTMEIRRINLDNLNEGSILTDSISRVEEEICPVQPPADSFFLGGEDPPSENEDKQEESLSETETWSKNRKDMKYNERFRTNSNEKKRSWSKPEFKTRKEFKNPSFKKTKEFNQDSKKEVQGSKEEVLHPSWEAKRKLKDQAISLTSFQGKKIKFDDD